MHPPSAAIPRRAATLVLAALAAAGTPARGADLPDGYLARQVNVLIYPGDPGFAASDRGLTVEREIALFEGYLWRHSLRRLSVEARVTIIPRPLLPGEFRDYGEQFGQLLDRSSRVEADLQARGIPPGPLILLYDAPPDHPARLAGRTFFEGSHSSIPLRDAYFQEQGFFRPLHLVMAHEFMHQIDLEFSRLDHPTEFLDPDGAGMPDYPACIDPGGGDLSLRSLLKFNRACQPVRWDLLAPIHGEWVGR